MSVFIEIIESNSPSIFLSWVLEDPPFLNESESKFSTKIDFQDIGYGDVDWIELA